MHFQAECDCSGRQSYHTEVKKPDLPLVDLPQNSKRGGKIPNIKATRVARIHNRQGVV
jgi:hypothetical protein